jgi:arrestin-related trafficking adapter 4/5/7
MNGLSGLITPGSIVESIEGLADAHIKYKLKAVVTRGRQSHNLYAFNPVYIIRTSDPSALECAMPVSNFWQIRSSTL